MAEVPQKTNLLEADRNRGIQNAASANSRFKEQRKGQLLSTQLMEEAGRKRYERGSEDDSTSASNDPSYDTPNQNRPQKIGGQIQYLENELRGLGNSGDFAYEEGSAEALIENPPKSPSFPILIVPVAILKDIVDAADFTGIGIIVTTVISFLLSLILFLWVLGKAGGGGGWWKKKLIGKLWKRYLFAIVIEFIPLLKIIPATTIFVLMAHYSETKIVKMLNGALERMRSGGMRGG